MRAISRHSGRMAQPGAIVLALVFLAGLASLSDADSVLASSPPWPAVVDAQGHSDTTLEVMWTPVPGATSYSVYRDQGSAPVGTTQATLYDDTAGAPNTTYNYRVTATVAGVESLPSATATVTTQAPHDSTPPTAVGTISVSSITSSSAKISWGQSSDNVGIEGYRIYRGAPGDPVSSLKDIDTTDAVASYQPTALLAGTGYQFGIQALDAAGNLSAVKTVSFSTATASPGTAPQPPPSSSIVVTPFSSTRIDVTWGTSSGASLYQVSRDGAVIGSVAVPDRMRLSDNGLAASTTHTYTITAVSSTGVHSTVSAAKTTTTLASGTVRVARGPYVMSVTQNSAKLAWWTNLPTPAVATVGPSGPTTTFSDPTSKNEHVILVGPLAPGTTYQYAVGNGSVSASGSFTTPAPPGTPFSFAAIGDFGGNAPGETQNASLIAGEGTQLIQTLGDNIYPEAADPNFVTTISDYDTRFYKQFRSALSGQVFSPANGNKEYYGNGAWFQHMWLPNNERWYSYDRGDAHVLVLDAEQPFAAGTPQYLFAQGDLASHQSAAWRIVIMPRPPYSSTSANSSSILARSQLVPLFQSQHVQLVLSGNSHNYERTFPLIDGSAAAGGITYIVSGAGGNGFNGFSGAAPAYSAFRESSYYEHLRITVSPTSLQVNSIRADTGAAFDGATITNSSPTGAVTGTVTNASGGAAIAGATVSDGGGGPSTTTNGSGIYTLSGLTPVSHSLTASASGYTSVTQLASVTAGTTTTSNFALTSAPTPPPLVQAAGATETAAATSLTATFGSPTATGHLLVLSASVYAGSTNNISSVTDSAANTWTKIGSYFVAGHYSNGEMWYAANARPATTVTVHVATAAGAAVEIMEFSGIAPTAPLDVAAGTSNTSTSPSSGPVTPTASSDLVVGFVAGHSNGETMTVTAGGYTTQPQQTSVVTGSTASVVTGYRALTSASVQTFTGSFTTAMYWASGIAAFKAGP